MTTLREARVTRLLSIRELARQASVAPSTIYLIETGQSTPRLAIIRRISLALQIEATEVDEFRHAIELVKHPNPRSD
jgi:transcriptional regulator with XRE-family HTH domain